VKILLLHPDDDPSLGPWAQQLWDRLIDLGTAGSSTYDVWRDLFHCPGGGLPKTSLQDLQEVRRPLFSGLGGMMESHGVDWWELISIGYHERVERVLCLEKLADQMEAGDEVWVSRDGLDRQVMEILLGRAVGSMRPADSTLRGLRRIGRAAARLRVGQMREILGDKYDTGYRVRRLVSRQVSCKRPVVLLPTAYVNVSRTGLAYAVTLPDRDFLLVTTRESGWVTDPPKNVAVSRLAAYAPGKYRKDEYQYLLDGWRKVLAEFRDRRELFVLSKLRAFDRVPRTLGDGLAIRDAWIQVFEREPVTAVLCADDSNPYTRLPLLLARQRGLPAIACHHGALDGRHLIKRSHADVILAKGRMEHDYLTRVCGVPRKQVEIGAPIQKHSSAEISSEQRDKVVFFSEPYEMAGGRTAEFYREVLPSLAEIAAATDRELVIKLHPQESLRERQELVKGALSSEQLKLVRLVEGPLSEKLLAKTWFAVTVLSTAALDCTLRGIPVFLCGWLDYSTYQYVEQFSRFGAGTRMNSPGGLGEIPNLVDKFSPVDTRDLWESIAPGRLEQLLAARERVEVAAAV
jgi:hypothetical protein